MTFANPKVSNLLHHLSIRRGIQVLRQNGFSPSCLKRRASPEEKERNSLPIEVSLWSNHRVMEWLRHVDLAEYAPNLRGSGVHGGLLIYEPRFTAELFASLLSIPANKTLLRRHLGLHFRHVEICWPVSALSAHWCTYRVSEIMLNKSRNILKHFL